ncbi:MULTISPECIES: hypothetical protein [unclassified Saccharicrinis]|uniref:hypothetical protein n=1 Tax=unclassified Saccharicrinis TaxID=2646859 RepID=UPI003D356C1E
MEIIAPKNRHSIKENNKTFNAFVHFNRFLAELRTNNLPNGIIDSINGIIERFNGLSDSGVDYRRQIAKMQSRIYTLLEKELGLVPKGYYKHKWLAVGMVAFGIPIGVVIGAIIGNVGLLGVGLPIGLVIGAVIGSQKDKKALSEGKQLDIKM